MASDGHTMMGTLWALWTRAKLITICGSAAQQVTSSCAALVCLLRPGSVCPVWRVAGGAVIGPWSRDLVRHCTTPHCRHLGSVLGSTAPGQLSTPSQFSSAPRAEHTQHGAWRHRAGRHRVQPPAEQTEAQLQDQDQAAAADTGHAEQGGGCSAPSIQTRGGIAHTSGQHFMQYIQY